MVYGLVGVPKGKTEKIGKAWKESVDHEAKVNKNRDGQNLVTVIIKDGKNWFAPNKKLRDKFYHAVDLNSPIPETFDFTYLNKLDYLGKLDYLRNQANLPEIYVQQFGRDLRLHILDPNTKIIPGTWGANFERITGAPQTQGYHFYNNETGIDAFFLKDGNLFRSVMKLNDGQKSDLNNNQNVT